MKLRHKVVPAVYLVAVKNNHILLGLRQNTGYCDNFFGLPSGHVEENESPTEALLRETKEEIGIVLKNTDIQFATVMARNSSDRECVDYFFVCDGSNFEVTNCEPDKCKFWKFFDLKDLPENTIPYIEFAIEAIQKKQNYVEYGWDE